MNENERLTLSRRRLIAVALAVALAVSTAGMEINLYKDRMPETDTAMVPLLKKSGAIMLDKTAWGALAWGDACSGGEAAFVMVDVS